KGKAPDVVTPDDNQTEVRLAYDDTYLYVGAEMRFTKPPKLPEWGKKMKPGEKTNLGWRISCMEICLDPERDRTSYFQIIPNLQDWLSEGHYGGWGSKVGSGAWWDSGIEFKTSVGEKVAVIEARIPFKNLGGVPRPGDRWGAQFSRNLNGTSTWSYMYDFLGFRCPKQFGTIEFE
ncbi:MAG: DOMON domain-containing protein, partial [Planctomycetota bacterium]